MQELSIYDVVMSNPNQLGDIFILRKKIKSEKPFLFLLERSTVLKLMVFLWEKIEFKNRSACEARNKKVTNTTIVIE
jgi:hypothetical protein